MKHFTKEQKDVLLSWAQICKKKKELGYYLDFVYYNDDQEAFADFGEKKIYTPYDEREEWLDMFFKLKNDGIIKQIRADAYGDIRRNFLFGFTSWEAVESIINELKN